MNISQNTYSKIESGGIKLTVERLQQIADVLEVPIESLINGNDQQLIPDISRFNLDKNYDFIEHNFLDKEVVLNVINTLSEQITYLRKENERLMEIISKTQKK